MRRSWYIIFIIIYGLISPQSMPLPETREPVTLPVIGQVLLSVVPPILLILLVLGSIFFGFATPTEASGVGAMGATLLALFARNLNLKIFKDVMRKTLNTTGFIGGIFITANFFAFILRRYGGDEIIENLVLGSFENPYMVVAFILFLIFLLGKKLTGSRSLSRLVGGGILGALLFHFLTEASQVLPHPVFRTRVFLAFAEYL